MESDRMGHLLGVVTQAKLDEQRGVVQNEKRQRENAPYGKVWDLIPANTYPAGHPYSWTVIGSMDDLNAASMEDVRGWFGKYYGAGNAVIAIAGDITAAEAKAKVEKYFGDIPSGPPVPRQRSWVAKMRGEHRQTLQDRVPQARIYKVWNVPERSHAEATRLQIAGEVLAGTKNSRLYKRLVYEDQIATDVFAGLDAREIGSQFIVWATAQPGADLAQVEKVLDEEMKRFLRKGPTADELEGVRTRLVADFLRSLERIGGFGGKSDLLASGEVYDGDPASWKKDLAVLREATPAQVRHAARAWLSDGVYALAVTPYPDHTTTATDADRKKVPETGEPPNLKLPAIQRATLKNGMKVVLAERHAAPVVEMTLLTDTGFAADSDGKPGLATLTFEMLDEGTRSRDALQVAAGLERIGASVSTGSTLDTSQIGLSSISNLLDPALEIYADLVRNPSFPEKELERLRKQRIATIQQEKSKPMSLAWRTLPPLLYGEQHAYGLPLTGSGTEESVKAITVDDLRQFHRAWVRPDNATLVVVGDTTLDKLVPLLEKHFGGWTAPDNSPPRKNLAAVELPAEPRIFLMDRPGAEQAVIIAGHVAPPYDADANIRFETLNAVLGGMFTSRLNMNLRETRHWSYGARSMLMEAKGQQPFVAYAPVQIDRTADAMREILGEVTRMRSIATPTAAELVSAQNNLTRTLPGEHETNGSIASTLSEAVIFALPDDYYATYVSRVRGLATADLASAAGDLLRPEHLTWVVVGDLGKIEAPVRALGFGKVRVLDKDGNPLPEKEPPPEAAEAPLPEADEVLPVTVFAYTLDEDETDDSEEIGAWGDRLDPERRPSVAVSRDLYERGLKRGARIRIKGFKQEFVVLDLMNPRWKESVDILMEDEDDALRWGRRKKQITWIKDAGNGGQSTAVVPAEKVE